MYNSVCEVIYLAERHSFRFVPAAGPTWQGDWDLGKQPLISIHQASADREQINVWADKYKQCNWLYVPGDAQAVLDDDPRHGGDVLLRELEVKHAPLPRTAKARTGGGGHHRYFTLPPGLSFSQDIMGNAGLTLACGNKHGFVVPPCQHKSGKCYAWEAAPWDVPIASCPDWLLALALAGARAGAAASPRATVVARPAPSPLPPLEPGPLVFVMGGGDGLAQHPGERTGNRHDTLCVLVGRELGRGRSPDELEPELLAWANRCDPPLEHARALRQLRTLSRKHEAQQQPTTPEKEGQAKEGAGSMGGKEDPAVAVATTDAIPASTPTPFLPFPPLPSLPSHSPEKDGKEAPTGEGSHWLSHGLAGRIAQAVAPQIEGSIEPVVVCLLSSLGSAIGPNASVRVGAEKHKANLFGVCVAPSGVGKSEPWAVCEVLMGYADAEWHRTAITGLGSGEGLIERLENQPIAHCIEAEFGGLLAKARRDGSTLTATVCNAWDGRRLEVANRGTARLCAEGHHVSLWANITNAELHKRLSTSLESVNGFGNRFLWLQQKRVRFLPRGGDLRCLENFAGALREAVAKARSLGEVTWSDEAGAIWDAAYPGLCMAQAAHWSLGRARSQALRLTLVYALLDGSDRIRPEHVRCGLSAWAWCETSAKAIFGVSDGPELEPVPAPPKPSMCFTWGGAEVTGGATTGATAEVAASPRAPARAPLEAQALARIEGRPGIGRGELAKATRAKAVALAGALATLHAEGRAHPRPRPGTGRTAQGWWPGPEAQQQPHTAEKEGSGRSEKEVSEGAEPEPELPTPSFPTLPSQGEGSPSLEPETMAEAEFLTGLGGGLLPALPSPPGVPSVGSRGVVVGPELELSETAWATLIEGMSKADAEREPERYPGESLARSMALQFARERGEHIPPEREAEWWAGHLARLNAAARALVERKGRWRH